MEVVSMLEALNSGLGTLRGVEKIFRYYLSLPVSDQQIGFLFTVARRLITSALASIGPHAAIKQFDNIKASGVLRPSMIRLLDAWVNAPRIQIGSHLAMAGTRFTRTVSREIQRLKAKQNGITDQVGCCIKTRETLSFK